MKHHSGTKLPGVVLAGLALVLLVLVDARGQTLPPPERLMDSLGLAVFKEEVAAPDFALPNLAGRKVRLSDYRGQVVFVAFWTTW